MRQAIYAVMIVMIFSIFYHLYGERATLANLNEKFVELTSEYEKVKDENDKLRSDIEYYSDPRNLEKELRSRFNYRAPNEKMIIVVPPQEGQ